MYRRVAMSVIALIVLLAACGRQITPSTSSTGLLPGYLRVRFATASRMDFTRYRYAMVFNTSGNGQEPYANAFTTSLLNYSFIWIIGAQSSGSVGYDLKQIYPVQSGIQSTSVAVPPSDVHLVLNTNGANSEFTLEFKRVLFATLNPTASPTPTGVNPMPTPTTFGQSIWKMNVFTIDGSNNILDAGGRGPNDTAFPLDIDTTQSIDNAAPFQKAVLTNVADSSAQIVGGEILNTP